jgi:hypothetical protein
MVYGSICMGKGFVMDIRKYFIKNVAISVEWALAKLYIWP